MLWQYGSGAWGSDGRTGLQNQSTPAVGTDGTIYVISDDFRIRAITPGETQGTHKWTSQTDQFGNAFFYGAPEHSPSVASDGTVWLATPGNPNHIYALNPTNGHKKADIEITSPKVISAAPAIDVNDWSFTVFTDCVVAVGQNSSGTYVKKWTHVIDFSKLKLPTMAAISTPSIQTSGGSTWTNQLIYWAEVDKDPVNAPDFANRIFALRQQQFLDGTVSTNEAWSWLFPGGKDETPVGHLTVNSTNGIYVIGKLVVQGVTTHKLYFINGNTGVGVSSWPMTLNFTPTSNPSLGVDGTIYVPCTDGLRAINPSTKSVTVLQSGMWVSMPPVVGVDGRLYFSYDSGNTANVRCISAAGSTVWTESISSATYRSSPLVMDRKGRLFALRSNASAYDTGQLVALKGSGRPGFSDWPMWGRGYSRNSRAGKTWRFMELDTLGGAYSMAEGISEDGRVVGGAHSNTGVYLGAHVVPGTYWWWGLFLNIPYDTPAFAANNYGIIVGYTLQNGGPQAYYTQGGWGQTLLDFLPSGHSAAAVAVNENARMVGYSHNASGVQRGVFWSYGSTTPTDILTLAGGGSSFSSTANAVSSSGRITGSSQILNGQYRAFLTGEDGIIQGAGNDLGTLSGGSYSAGHGINDAEAVTGTSDNASGVARIFYKPFGQAMQDVGLLAGASSGTGEDINNNNLIVGYCYVGSYARASVAVGGLTGVADLNNATSGITYQSLNVANAVNDREWIVGWGLNSGWSYRGFILRPNE